MDGELERYHKNNATLDLTIGDFKLKQNGLQKEVVRQRSATQDGEQAIRSAGGLCLGDGACFQYCAGHLATSSCEGPPARSPRGCCYDCCGSAPWQTLHTPACRYQHAPLRPALQVCLTMPGILHATIMLPPPLHLYRRMLHDL